MLQRNQEEWLLLASGHGFAFTPFPQDILASESEVPLIVFSGVSFAMLKGAMPG
jgi:hypothetical protein